MYPYYLGVTQGPSFYGPGLRGGGGVSTRLGKFPGLFSVCSRILKGGPSAPTPSTLNRGFKPRDCQGTWGKWSGKWGSFGDDCFEDPGT